jgi:hypothetical protein
MRLPAYRLADSNDLSLGTSMSLLMTFMIYGVKLLCYGQNYFFMIVGVATRIKFFRQIVAWTCTSLSSLTNSKFGKVVMILKFISLPPSMKMLSSFITDNMSSKSQGLSWAFCSDLMTLV